MKKNKIFGLGVGTTSALMLFVVICLVMLAILSYMIVNTDTAIVEKKISYSIRYQMADNVAVETLAKVDDKLYEISQKRIAFANEIECRNIMDTLEGVSVDYKKQQISYRVGLDDNSSLMVLLQVNTHNKLVSIKERYSIVKWQIVPESKEIGKNALNVWGKGKGE